MSEDNQAIPYEEALKLVGAVMEEEHISEPGRRILTVYDTQDRELCWFDAEEIMSELGLQEGGLPQKAARKADEFKVRAVELILHQIPVWAVKKCKTAAS